MWQFIDTKKKMKNGGGMDRDQGNLEVTYQQVQHRCRPNGTDEHVRPRYGCSEAY